MSSECVGILLKTLLGSNSLNSGPSYPRRKGLVSEYLSSTIVEGVSSKSQMNVGYYLSHIKEPVRKTLSPPYPDPGQDCCKCRGTAFEWLGRSAADGEVIYRLLLFPVGNRIKHRSFDKRPQLVRKCVSVAHYY